MPLETHPAHGPDSTETAIGLVQDSKAALGGERNVQGPAPTPIGGEMPPNLDARQVRTSEEVAAHFLKLMTRYLQAMSCDDAGSTEEIDASKIPFEIAEYWHALIDERSAAEFVDLTVRTLQALRQKGGGPRFVRLSARAVKYRRADLRQWIEARLVSSTSDPGQVAE